MSKHTPGPWHTGAFGNQIVYAADGWAVANAQVSHHQNNGFEEMQANASLIAAAPDLLADSRALMAVVVTHKCPSCGVSWSDNECTQMLDEKAASCICGYRHKFDGAAIAKATGEQA